MKPTVVGGVSLLTCVLIAGCVELASDGFDVAHQRSRWLADSLMDRRAWHQFDLQRTDTAVVWRVLDSLRTTCGCTYENMRLIADKRDFRIDEPDELTFTYVTPSRCGPVQVLFTYRHEGDSVWLGPMNLQVGAETGVGVEDK